MARKQLSIKGTERKQHPAIEEAAEKYREARDERMELTKREVQAKAVLVATMQAQKVAKYKFDDAEGEELLVEITEKVDVKVRKTGEAADALGEAVEESGRVDDPSIPKGLIAQALKAQEEAGVSESADGDITVPDKAAPKKPRKAKKAS